MTATEVEDIVLRWLLESGESVDTELEKRVAAFAEFYADILEEAV